MKFVKPCSPVAGRGQKSRVSARLDLFTVRVRGGQEPPWSSCFTKNKREGQPFSQGTPSTAFPRSFLWADLSPANVTHWMFPKSKSAQLCSSVTSFYCTSSTQEIYPGVQPHCFFLFTLQPSALKDCIIRYRLIIEIKKSKYYNDKPETSRN